MLSQLVYFSVFGSVLINKIEIKFKASLSHSCFEIMNTER